MKLFRQSAIFGYNMFLLISTMVSNSLSLAQISEVWRPLNYTIGAPPGEYADKSVQGNLMTWLSSNGFGNVTLIGVTYTKHNNQTYNITGVTWRTDNSEELEDKRAIYDNISFVAYAEEEDSDYTDVLRQFEGTSSWKCHSHIDPEDGFAEALNMHSGGSGSCIVCYYVNDDCHHSGYNGYDYLYEGEWKYQENDFNSLYVRCV